jgi:ABC-type multidrug transport system fused ATPase/permease subunit
LARLSNTALVLVISSLSRLVAIAFSAPAFIIPGLVIGAFGGFLGQIYLRAQMSVKRERSNAKSLVVAEVNDAFTGLVSIRAFGVQQRFTQQSVDKINAYMQLSILMFK